MWKRGQSAVEYLTIVTLSLLILIPTAFYVLSYANDLQGQTQSRQLGVVGEQIISTVNEVYASEPDSFIRLTVELPETTRNVTIQDNRELVISVQSQLGESDLVFFSENVNITANGTTCSPACQTGIDGGSNNIRVENAREDVTIYS
jgi:hypothetical protein